jgi:hypothetical protein
MSTIDLLKNEIDDTVDAVEDQDYVFTDEDRKNYREVLCGFADSLGQHNRPWAQLMLDDVDTAIEDVDAEIAACEAARREAEARPVEDFLKILTGFVGFLLFCSWLNANKTIV